jgi:hypothetical protein
MKSHSNAHFINWTINQSVDKLKAIALMSGRKPYVSPDLLAGLWAGGRAAIG